MSNEGAGRRPVKVDLELCYSGFKIDELEYIDYTRSSTEPEDQFLETFSGKPGGDSLAFDDEDELLTGAEYEELRSYLCSTPTASGRKHRGYFPQEDLSGFNDLEYVQSFPPNLDSGHHTQEPSRSNSMLSLYDDRMCGSTDSLIQTKSGDSTFGEERRRRKIELDADIHNPYRSIEDLDLSIEDENDSVGGMGTLRRRLSLKVLRRNISGSGLFGSYLLRGQTGPPGRKTTPEEGITETKANPRSGQTPLVNKTQGPLNLWFKKFRNRHFI